MPQKDFFTCSFFKEIDVYFFTNTLTILVQAQNSVSGQNGKIVSSWALIFYVFWVTLIHLYNANISGKASIYYSSLITPRI